MTRTKMELIRENAFLRQQMIIRSRQVGRPTLTWRYRALLVLLASRLRTWKESLLIVQPDTLLRWHREMFHRVWKHKSKKKAHRPPLTETIVALVRQMAIENPGWGAKRIRGEWACDFLQTYDALFRALFVFAIIELKSRRVVHFAVTRNPSDPWVAQQLRNATPFGEAPRFLIHDNDCKYGASFAQVAKGTHIEVLRTPIGAPKANAICERFLGSLRRECLDYFLIFGERHLHRIVKEYVAYFNHARPHQGINQQIPCPTRSSPQTGLIVSLPVLGGVHHDYQRRAA